MKITRYADIEIRSADEQTRTVAGVAAVFNREQPMGWYTESIDEHAFDETDMSDTILNFNHNDDIVLAGVKNGSLQLEVREDGLHVTEARIVGTTQGNDVLTLVREGLIDKMSFAFTVDEDEWETRDGRDFRKITKIGRLFDCSLVTFPAYPQTYVGLRKADEEDELVKKHLLWKEQEKKMEELLNGKDFKQCDGQ